MTDARPSRVFDDHRGTQNDRDDRRGNQMKEEKAQLNHSSDPG